MEERDFDIKYKNEENMGWESLDFPFGIIILILE